MKPFVVRRVVTHNYIRKEKIVTSSGYYESDSTKAHLGDEMSNVIKDTSPSSPECLTTMKLSGVEPSTSGVVVLKIHSPEERASDEKRMEINCRHLQSHQSAALSVDAGVEQTTTGEDAVIEAPLKMNETNINGDSEAGFSNAKIYHGVSGEVGDVKNLSEVKGLSQIYFKARLDSHKGGKKNRASFSQNNLFKTAFFPFSTRHHIGVPFQHRGTVSSSMYLILEVKGKGKGKTHDTIDYVAVSIGEMFAGNKYSSQWLPMENGASIHVTMTCKEIEAIPGSPGRTGRSRLSFRKKNPESTES